MTDVIIARSVPGGTIKVRSSKNLHAIIEHNRATRSKPEAYIARMSDDSVTVGLNWPDGSFCSVPFASYSVAREWFTKRASSITTVPGYHAQS